MRSLVILLVVCLASCTPSQINKVPGESNVQFFKDEIQAFDFDITDSTVLIYSNIQPFDTSFVLTFCADSNGSKRAKFLYYPPSYYNDFTNWKSLKVFLYKGINFQISKDQWDSISNRLKSNDSVLRARTTNYETEILHEPIMKLYFNRALLSNKNFENPYFYNVYSILINDLVNKLYRYYPMVNGQVH